MDARTLKHCVLTSIVGPLPATALTPAENERGGNDSLARRDAQGQYDARSAHVRYTSFRFFARVPCRVQSSPESRHDLAAIDKDVISSEEEL